MTEEEKQQEADDIAYVNGMKARTYFRHGNYGKLVGREKDYAKEKYQKRGKFYFKKFYYGLDKEAFLALVAEQEGKCKICGAYLGDDLQVDHSHVCGEIRGLLCRSCNTGLGAFKDDPGLMEKAAKYIYNFMNKHAR